MTHEFQQDTVDLASGNPTGKLKVSKLLTIIDNHPYKEEIIAALDIESLKDDIISINNIDSAFIAVKNENERFKKLNVLAETRNVDVNIIESEDAKIVEFKFEECHLDDELLENLSAEGIYNSKNTFFDEHKMSKYVNHLYDGGFSDLVNINVQYFKNLASENEDYNKEKSYRLLNKDEKYYLRGITSEKYNEYGIDFTFFVTVILLHIKMKQEKGNNYSLVYLSISESKLDMIIKDNRNLKIENFGNVSLGIKVSTNELGNGSLNITSTLRIENEDNKTLVYLFPRDKNQVQTKYVINHITSLAKVFSQLNEFAKLFNIAEDFAKDIKDIRGIKTPDQLRNKIQMKIEHPASVFKNMTELKDIFKLRISNEIDNFSKLLLMCRKAEELEMDYDIKDKLRYIISDIILYGSVK